MSLRSFIYQVLTTDSGLAALELDPKTQVLMAQSMMSAQVPKPYIVVQEGNDTDEQIFDDPDVSARPNRQFFTVWVHDARPSFVQIDTISDLVKAAFRVTTSSPGDGIIQVKFLERSTDFDDITLDTIFRYQRFQAIMI